MESPCLSYSRLRVWNMHWLCVGWISMLDASDLSCRLWPVWHRSARPFTQSTQTCRRHERRCYCMIEKVQLPVLCSVGSNENNHLLFIWSDQLVNVLLPPSSLVQAKTSAGSDLIHFPARFWMSGWNRMETRHFGHPEKGGPTANNPMAQDFHCLFFRSGRPRDLRIDTFVQMLLKETEPEVEEAMVRFSGV